MKLTNFHILRLLIVLIMVQIFFIGCSSKINYENEAGVLNPSTWVYNFGYVKIGETETLQLIISNCGKQKLHIKQIGLSIAGGTGNNPGSNSDKFGDFSITKLMNNTKDPAEEVQLPIIEPIELKRDQNITVTIEFSPTSTLLSFAALEITHDGINKNPAIVELMSVPQTPEINVMQDTYILNNGSGRYTFDKVVVGSSSQAVEFTIENQGIGELQISLPTLSQGDTSQFALDTIQTLQDLSTGTSTTFGIKFMPTSEGEKSATVSIANNDPDENPFTFVVSGNRQPFAPAVYGAKANPDAVSANGSDETIFIAHVEDKNGLEDIVSVKIDLTAIEGNSAQLLYDDGSNGDEVADDSVFSFKYTMPNNAALYGVHELTVTATDSDGLTGTGVAYLGVASGNVIHVDANNGADDDKGYWHLKSPMPTPRRLASCVLVNNKIYVIGGCGKDSENYYNNNEVYDPETDSWEIKRETLSNRRCAGVVSNNGKIYYVCGTEWNGGGVHSDKIDEYDTHLDVWQSKTKANVSKTNFAQCTFNNELYRFGGSNDIQHYTDIVEKYNPLTETWTTLEKMNYSHVHSSAAVYQSKVYVTGGFYTSHFNNLSIYDVSSNTWDFTKTDMQNTRVEHVMAELNGKIYAIGGIVGSSFSETVEVYDPVLDSWSYASSLNEGKADTCVIVYDDRIYVFGGIKDVNTYYDTVEMFVPKGDGTEQYPFRTIQKGIEEASDGDLVWVHDGTYNGGASTDISRNRDLDFNGKKIIVFGNPRNPEAVTIDCEGTSTDQHRGFHFHTSETNNSILCGITIQNGYETDGAGINCLSSSPTILSCVFKNNNAASHGGGIYCLNNSNSVLRNCFFIYNEATNDGGGICCRYSSSLIIDNCTIRNNKSSIGGGLYGYDDCNAQVEQCTISSNMATGHSGWAIGGGVFFHKSETDFQNCDISNNTAKAYATNIPAWGGGMYLRYGNSTLSNCLISSNEAICISVDDSQAGAILFEQCNFTISNNTIVRNYCSEHTGGILIGSNISGKIANTIIQDNKSTDSGNEIGIVTTSNEIIIENCNVSTNIGDIYDTGNHINSSKTPKGFVVGEFGNISEDPKFVEGPRGVYYLEKNGVGDGKTDSPCIDAGSANTNTFSYLEYTTTYVDNSEDAGVVDMGYHYPAYSIREIYVDAELGDDRTGDGSESKPYKTIQKGIDVAGEGDIVWVESGTYRGDGNRDLDMHGKAVKVKGKTVDPDDVIIDCEGTETNPHRGFYFHSGETLASQIHALTICHGFAPEIWDTIFSEFCNGGGGVYLLNSSPTLNKCIIRNCRTYSLSNYVYGAGICIQNSDPMLSDCVVSYNEVSNSLACHGCGVMVWNNSNPIFINCEISNNIVKNVSGASHGCGISIGFDSNPIAKNCIISSNKVESNQQTDGIGIAIGSCSNGGFFYNCTIASNYTTSSKYDTYGGGVNIHVSNPKFTNCIFYGNGNAANRGSEVSMTPDAGFSALFNNCCIDNESTDIYDTASHIVLNSCERGEPKFVKGMNGNYYLDSGSPCIDKGSGQAEDYAFLDGRTTSVTGEADTGIVDMGYHYQKEAQGPYAIGWIGGGSDGWQTTNGTSPNADYQSLHNPRSVFVDSIGNIYVADRFNQCIRKWDKNGNAIGWIGGGKDGWQTGSAPSSNSDFRSFLDPVDVFVDSTGNIFVVDCNNHRISKWDSNGIAIGWIGGSSDGWRKTNGSTLNSDYKSFNGPHGIFVDTSGYIYVSDCSNNRISKWDKNGNAIGWLGGGQDGWQTGNAPSSSSDYKWFNRPIGIYVATNGDIYVAEGDVKRISKWDKNGKAIGWIGGGKDGWQTGNAPSAGVEYNNLNYPSHVFLDKRSNIYVADMHNHRVCKWNKDGIALGWIGGGSKGWQYGSAPASSSDVRSFYYLYDVYVDSSNNIFVADRDNHRVCKWKDK